MYAFHVTKRDCFQRHKSWLRLDSWCGLIVIFLLAAAAIGAGGQKPDKAAAQVAPVADKPVVITLGEAIRRAETSEPAYALSSAQSRSAALDRSIALAGLLPNARFYSQDIYTQPNGIYTEGDAGEPSAPLPRFVANDSRPREYIAQGIVDETFSLAGPAAVRRADAAAAQAAAEQEIARRGLVAGGDRLVLQLSGGGSQANVGRARAPGSG